MQLSIMLQTTIEDYFKKDSVTNKMTCLVLARDELPNHVKYPSCLIINTKPREHEGEHWLAFYFDEKGHADFFDSYGQEPDKYGLKSFLDKTSVNWSYNNKRIQGFSAYCGHYCLMYLFFRVRNKSNVFFSFFNNNYLNNDKKVTTLINYNWK